MNFLFNCLFVFDLFVFFVLFIYFILLVLFSLSFSHFQFYIHSLTHIDLICLPVWASLIAHLVKNPPAMQETPSRFLGWEDPLDKG